MMMNENQFFIVNEYNVNNPTISEIDKIIDNSKRDCHNNYFHTFNYICEYDLKFTNTNNELVNFTISDKNMGMYEFNEKLTLARKRSFIFNHIKKLTIEIYSNLSNINIHYHLRLGAPPLHRQFFIKISKNRDYIQTHCNDLHNSFHFGCRQWYKYNNPQCDMV